MDITPASPAGRQIVESYGQRRFRVSGTLYEGSVLVFPERTLAWTVGRIEELTLESLDPLLDAAGELELLLIGCGPRMAQVPGALREGLRARGLVVEPMDTGAACRTYNVLVSEDRRIAAALIAVA
ncbi:MAG: Mth938-like domain-containing protein [Kiloniellaceae bacterium]